MEEGEPFPQTVIGHLFAGAAAYPYVLTQRCNNVSFSQVRGCNKYVRRMGRTQGSWRAISIVSYFRYLGERTMGSQRPMSFHASSSEFPSPSNHLFDHRDAFVETSFSEEQAIIRYYKIHSHLLIFLVKPCFKCGRTLQDTEIQMATHRQ